MQSHRTHRQIAFAAVALAVLLIAGWFNRHAANPIARQDPQTVAPARASDDTTMALPPTARPITNAAAPSAAPHVPSDNNAPARLQRARMVRDGGSLRGTQPDGRARLDPTGRAILDRDLRRLFDYYLSLSGELEIDDIRLLLAADLAQTLPASALQQFLDCFDRYVQYERQLASSDSVQTADLPARLAALKALRRAVLGPAAEGFFADEELYADVTLARLEIAHDHSLDAQQRAARLTELEQRLSPAQRVSMQEAGSASMVDEQTRELEQSHADPATRDAERSALWGNDAAARLAELDRRRAEFDARVAAYAAQRERILADRGRSQAQQQIEIEQLRRRSFDEGERARIEALEAIGQLPKG